MSKSRKNQFTRQAYPSEEDKVNAAEAAEDVKDKDSGAEADKPAEQEDALNEVPADGDVALESAESVSREELERAVAEAEQRGYRRGRNEMLSQPMRRNGIWEQPHRQDDAPAVAAEGDDADDDLVLLRRIRPSIWD